MYTYLEKVDTDKLASVADAEMKRVCACMLAAFKEKVSSYYVYDDTTQRGFAAIGTKSDMKEITTFLNREKKDKRVLTDFLSFYSKPDEAYPAGKCLDVLSTESNGYCVIVDRDLCSENDTCFIDFYGILDIRTGNYVRYITRSEFEIFDLLIFLSCETLDGRVSGNDLVYHVHRFYKYKYKWGAIGL